MLGSLRLADVFPHEQRKGRYLGLKRSMLYIHTWGGVSYDNGKPSHHGTDTYEQHG